MKRRARIVGVLALGSSVAGIAYASGHAPPEGWRIPVSAPTPKKASSACAGDDVTRCERQRAVDGATHPVIASGVDVPLETIPLATVREAANGQSGLDGAPSLRFLDGQGKPPPWKDGPQGELRVLPPGELGEINLKKEGYTPYFQKVEYRGFGYGWVRTTTNGKVDCAGPYAFTSIGPGTGGKLSFDHVEGILDDSLKMDVRKWVHADIVPIAKGTLFAFRQPGKDGEELHVVMPEVVRVFESLGVDVDGAFVESRFSRVWSFSDYVFPVKADLGLEAIFTLQDTETRRWRASGATPEGDWSSEIHLDLNGTAGGTFVLRIRLPTG